MIGGISCLFLWLSVVNFNIRLNFWTILRRLRLRIWHACSTHDALSNGTKVNDLVTLTLTFLLNIAFSDCCHRRIVFHKHMHVIINCNDTMHLFTGIHWSLWECEQNHLDPWWQKSVERGRGCVRVGLHGIQTSIPCGVSTHLVILFIFGTGPKICSALERLCCVGIHGL